MTDTPIAILEQAADLGVKLSFIPPDTLDVNASRPWPKDFAGTLRANKSELIALLRSNAPSELRPTTTKLGIPKLPLQRDVNPPPPSQAIAKKCVICGIEYLGWPLSEYCSNGCAIAGHREWIRQGKNPSKARLKSLRQQSHFKLILVSYGYE